ncbi:hypothetical protein V5O48_016887 [Marasmius crinis-equi]|uniref:Uncharacterized protein n=1 Tax=Marasmius crinis-equi TaxID=585013 RepID=A0ABR3EQJ4_9AGAR
MTKPSSKYVKAAKSHQQQQVSNSRTNTQKSHRRRTRNVPGSNGDSLIACGGGDGIEDHGEEYESPEGGSNKRKRQKSTRPVRLGNFVPNIDSYAPVHSLPTQNSCLLPTARHCPEVQEDCIPQLYEYHLRHAKNYITRFNVPMSWAELEEQAGNMDHYESLMEMVEEMKDPSYPVQAVSGIWELEGHMVMVFLSNRFDSKEEGRLLPLSRQHDLDRLVQMVKAAQDSGQSMKHDGLKEPLLTRYYESSHVLCAYNNPKADHTKQRHGVAAEKGKAVHTFPISSQTPWTADKKEARLMPGVLPERGLVYSPDNGEHGQEAAGVHHHVEGWEQRGHKGQGLYQSKSLSGSGHSIIASQNFYRANQCLEECVENTIKVFFEDQHKVFTGAREAARLAGNKGGCFIGRAMVFKLQLFLHCDEGDDGVSASFPAGRFKGGCMIIPQFKAKLLPGDLLLIHANKVWHVVDVWEATKMSKNHTTTPGRIGTVFFFPSDSLPHLEGREPGWGADTMFGAIPSARPRRHV